MLSQSPSGRLLLVLQPTSEEVFEPDAVADAPLVLFIAYGVHHRVFGWVRLRADRLTDLLNAHEELHLAEVEIESLEDGTTRSVDEIIIQRRELVAVHATGPRGDPARRQKTRMHPLAIQSGKYLIAGHVHANPGVDPIASLGARPAMLPLTDAWIEYWSDGERKHQSTGTIVVNRDGADWMRVVTDEDLIGGGLRPTARSARPG
ncbi:MAG: hypothetical protein M3P84_02125 [Chloroflexota bacterium]|nr:hypothetical protein [Chloroflexota bacterium]